MPKTNTRTIFKWTPDSDALLKRLVPPSRKGWSSIAQQLKEEMLIDPKFAHVKIFPNGKKCNEHWQNKLNETVIRGPFSHAQIDLILARRREGIGVSAIAKELNFAINDVKNTCFAEVNRRYKHNCNITRHINVFFPTQDKSIEDSEKADMAADHSRSPTPEPSLFHHPIAEELYMPYFAAQLQTASSGLFSEEDESPLKASFS